ncbi:MAG TPA: prolipoprotein diacylglyceryl transferase [Steroidobacteraceae bacterium]|jgi:phosphatidylglycerol:prolipoprotein diacylglycerol transferase|nr:prolipoprotein diacylglyceryl transferase [Steroidobacteraceae bacterium]
MIVYPRINPIAVKLGPLSVHWYGIMYLVGFAAAWWLARRRAAQPNSSWRAVDVDDFLFFAMLGVILGGRIGYVLFYGLPLWRGDPLYPLKIWEGGMSFHGGLLGVLTAVAIFAVRRARHIGDVFDFTAPLPGIGLFCGRLGNFINGELWGRPTTVPWAFLVPNPNGGPPVPRHPSQLYEAFFEGLLLFTILWIFTRRPRPRYAPAGLFLVCYALARIGVEFVREPDIGIGYLAFGWLTMGQLLSLPMLLAGLVLLWAAYHYRIPSGNFGQPPARSQGLPAHGSSAR